MCAQPGALLQIYFGASAGFGNTCAMLAAASAARNQGTALIVGLMESHGRAETESKAKARNLPRMPAHAAEGGSLPRPCAAKISIATQRSPGRRRSPTRS